MQKMFIGILLLSLSITFAQDEKKVYRIESLSIRDCLIRALRYNLLLKSEQYNPRLRKEDVTIAESDFDPVFRSSVNHSNNLNPNVRNVFDGANFVDIVAEVYNVTTNVDTRLTQAHVYGGSFEVFGTMRYSRNAIDLGLGKDRFDSTYNYSTGFTVNQSLLRNFGVDVNTANIRISENNLIVARYALGARVLTLFADTQQAYLDLVNARENYELQRQSLKLSENFYKITLARIKAGSLAAADILDAERDVATKQDNLIVAEQNVLNAEDRLKQLMRPLDVEYYHNVRLVPIETPVYKKLDVSFDDSLEYALVHRADIRQARKNLETADINIKVQENQLLPSLDFTSSVGLAGNEFNSPDALEQVYDGDFFSWSVGLALEIPIGNRAAKSNLRKAILSKKQQIVDYQNLESQVIFQLRTTIRDLNTASRRVYTAKKTRELAEKQLANEENKYRAGIIALFQVQNTEQNLTAARINEVNALIDYQKAIVELERAKWDLASWLNKFQIRLPFEIGYE